MKKILTVLMIAMLLTAFAMPQEEQAAPADTSKYGFMRADLIMTYSILAQQKAEYLQDIEERMENILWAINYIPRLEAFENDTTKTETEEDE